LLRRSKLRTWGNPLSLQKRVIKSAKGKKLPPACEPTGGRPRTPRAHKV
jgi:hypothetical protein